MHVEFNFFGPMREAVGSKTVERSLPDDATVDDALRDAAEEYPDLRPLLFSDGDDLASRLTVTVNGTNVRQREGGETPLSDGDTLRLAPPVHGGRR